MNDNKSWHREEEDQLRMLFSEYSMSIYTLASIHKRSEEGIRSKLTKMQLYNDEPALRKTIKKLEDRVIQLELELAIAKQQILIHQLN